MTTLELKNRPVPASILKLIGQSPPLTETTGGMRIGIFGGTFDPVHYGHLLLAESCREQAQLDRVWFMPCATSPFKRQYKPIAGEHRAAMLRLASADQPAFEVSTLELERGGVSYTAETLEALHATYPEAEFFFLLGADSLPHLPNWRRPQEICHLAVPLAVQRPGASPPDFTPLAQLVSAERLAYFRTFQVHMPAIGLSSTEIRRRVEAGESIRYQTPPEVVRYIAEHQLYQSH